MACNCIKEVNEVLAPHNTELVFTFMTKPNKICVETTQIEAGRGKKKAAKMLASFCPFCGTKYEATQP